MQELGEWKKQNAPSLEEDFARLQIDSASNEATGAWNERFDKAQSRNELAVKAYTEMCFTMDRIAKRQANQAKDYTRYGASLRLVKYYISTFVTSILIYEKAL